MVGKGDNGKWLGESQVKLRYRPKELTAWKLRPKGKGGQEDMRPPTIELSKGIKEPVCGWASTIEIRGPGFSQRATGAIETLGKFIKAVTRA